MSGCLELGGHGAEWKVTANEYGDFFKSDENIKIKMRLLHSSVNTLKTIEFPL